MAWTACCLRSALSSSRAVSPGSPKRAFAYRSCSISVLFAYGTENAVQDFWGEQIVKRGWTTAALPETLFPRASLAWAVLLLAGLAVAALSSRTFLRTRV